MELAVYVKQSAVRLKDPGSLSSSSWWQHSVDRADLLERKSVALTDSMHMC